MHDIATDSDGYLKHIEQWTPEVARQLAQEDQQPLTAAHWRVLDFARHYYQQFQVPPTVRILSKHLTRQYGEDVGSVLALYELFPHSPAKQACRYAGLPKPTCRQ